MKRSILAATAIAFSLSTFSPVQAGGITPLPPAAKTQADDVMVHKVGRRWRRGGRGLAIGAGIVTLGILGALAASKRARAHDDYYEEDHYYEHRDRCERWRRACRHGSDRACWRFDTRC